MSLAEVEQAIQRVCIAPTPSAEDLSLLGDSDVWLVYRSMVRRRLRGEVRRVFARTLDAVGEAAFDSAFDAVLAARPPNTRFFYRVPLWFAEAAAQYFESAPGAPAHASDLLRYEATRWEVSDLPGHLEAAPADFAFDAVPVLNPALRLLTLEHAVQRKLEADGAYPPGRQHLVIVRAGDDTAVKTWTVNAVTFDLLLLLGQRPVAVTEALASVAKQRGVALDAGFVDALCTVLADFIERGVILGSR